MADNDVDTQLLQQDAGVVSPGEQSWSGSARLQQLKLHFHRPGLIHTGLEDVLAWASLQTGQVRHHGWCSELSLCVVHLPCYQRSYSHANSLPTKCFNPFQYSST